MAITRVLGSLLIAASVAACSSSDRSDAGSAADVRSPTDSADAAKPGCADPSSLIVSADRGCNTLPWPATRVPFTAGTGSAPTFTGGTLVDGYYAAIKAEGWNVPTPTGRQMGLVIGNDGKTLLWFGQILNADGSGDVDAGTGRGWLRGNFNLSTSSTNTLDLGSTCFAGSGAQAPTQLLFTAVASDPPQLLLATAQDQVVSVTTYERQGCAPAP